MPDEKNPSGAVSNHVMEVNTVLVRNLVERFSEALSRINSTLEAGQSLDEATLSQLRQQVDIIKSIKDDATVILAANNEFTSSLSALREGLAPFFEDRPYHTEDRAALIGFVRRFTSAVANWSDQEKVAILDVVEKSPSTVLKLQSRLSRLYFIVAAAGITAILTSVGAPEWIKKLIQLLVGA